MACREVAKIAKIAKIAKSSEHPKAQHHTEVGEEILGLAQFGVARDFNGDARGPGRARSPNPENSESRGPRIHSAAGARAVSSAS